MSWKYGRALSGTPQGSVVSPILANIYLDRLDKYAKRCASAVQFWKALNAKHPRLRGVGGRRTYRQELATLDRRAIPLRTTSAHGAKGQSQADKRTPRWSYRRDSHNPCHRQAARFLGYELVNRKPTTHVGEKSMVASDYGFPPKSSSNTATPT